MPIFRARMARSWPTMPSASSAWAVVSNGTLAGSHSQRSFSGGNAATLPRGLVSIGPLRPAGQTRPRADSSTPPRWFPNRAAGYQSGGQFPVSSPRRCVHVDDAGGQRDDDGAEDKSQNAEDANAAQHAEHQEQRAHLRPAAEQERPDEMVKRPRGHTADPG